MQKLLVVMGQLLAAKEAAEKVTEILRTMVGPILTALGGAGTIYVIILGCQYAKAEDDGKRKDIKKRIWNLVIGIVAMFTLAALCIAIKWDSLVSEMFGYAWDDMMVRL